MATTAADLAQRLAEQPIVPMPATEWAELTSQVEIVERHATLVAGDLLIVRIGGLLAAVEEPKPDERVVRRLADDDEARSFVEGRLEQYERMWDGCGCKIEYYK
jgi:hypothetical protein